MFKEINKYEEYINPYELDKNYYIVAEEVFCDIPRYRKMLDIDFFLMK